MTSQTRNLIAERLPTIDAIAGILGRYGLVVVIGWIGALKFANFEAYQIQPLVANSPFMGWLYSFLPVYTFSALLGVFELAAAALLAIKPLAPKLSIAGSLLAIVLFVATISFLFTTPALESRRAVASRPCRSPESSCSRTSRCWACRSGHSLTRSGRSIAEKVV